MKIYLASSWRNQYQAEVLASLRGAGFEVYDFKNPAPGNVGFSWKQIDPDLAMSCTTRTAPADTRRSSSQERFLLDDESGRY